MVVRIGLNGVGRIGRNLWRIVHTSTPDVEIVAVNDTADLLTITNLLRQDSIRGRFPATVHPGERAIVVAGQPVPVTHAPAPEQIDWARHGVDLVVEATGQFTRRAAASGHLRAGAGVVIVSTASPDADVSLMMGINEQEFEPGRHRVISNSCCTTNCLAAMLYPLHQSYGVVSGTASVAYAYGSRPGPALDGVRKNLRMARAGATNLVPANVPGVRHALDRVMPALVGRISATAIRVPVRAVSTATLTARLQSPADVDEVNHTLHTAASSLLKGYLEVSDDPLVSSDVLGSPCSCIVDSSLTTGLHELVRVVGWYDNEWGYAHRLVDLARFVVNRTQP